MKKIISFVLGVCMTLSVGAGLTGCDKQEKERKAAEKKANNEKKQRELKEKDREKRNNGRFVAVEVKGDASMYIKDTKTGKKVQVPLFAFKETYNAIIDLMC